MLPDCHANYVYSSFIFYIIIYADKECDLFMFLAVMMCVHCYDRVAIRQQHSFHCAHFKTWTSTTTSVSCPSSMPEDSKFSLIFLSQTVPRAWYVYDVNNFPQVVCTWSTSVSVMSAAGLHVSSTL